MRATPEMFFAFSILLVEGLLNIPMTMVSYISLSSLLARSSNLSVELIESSQSFCEKFLWNLTSFSRSLTLILFHRTILRYSVVLLVEVFLMGVT